VETQVSTDNAGIARFFDIVNGFLIDAVAHWVKITKASAFGFWRDCVHNYRCNNLAEIIVRTWYNAGLCKPVVDGVDSQA